MRSRNDDDNDDWRRTSGHAPRDALTIKSILENVEESSAIRGLDCDKCSVINFIRVRRTSWIAQPLRRSRV